MAQDNSNVLQMEGKFIRFLPEQSVSVSEAPDAAKAIPEQTEVTTSTDMSPSTALDNFDGFKALQSTFKVLVDIINRSGIISNAHLNAEMKKISDQFNVGAVDQRQGQGGFQDTDEPVSTTGKLLEAAPIPEGSYRIKAGDTIDQIAADNTFTRTQLKESNPHIENFDSIKAGEYLNFPPVGVAKAGQLPESTEAYLEREAQIDNKNPQIIEAEVATEQPTVSQLDEGVSLRPKARPEIIPKEVIQNVVDAPTAEESIEAATEKVEEVSPDLLSNPINWIYKQNYIGLSENNAEQTPTIIGFFKNSLETDDPYRGTPTDKIPYDKNEIRKRSGAWCGVFVDHVLTQLGFNRLQGDKYLRLRAEKYGKLGNGVDLADAKQGDIVVKQDKGNWHVGFYVGRFKGISTADKKSVTRIQEALEGQGFDPKGVDGVWGKNTIAALNVFQKANGLEVTSKVTGELFKTLTGQEGKIVDTVLMLGGNQDNQVNVTAYPTSTVTNVRRIGDLRKIDKDIFTKITEDFSFGGSVG